MARRYSGIGQVAVQAAKTMIGLTNGGTAIRPKVYDILVGSSAPPADQAARFLVQRCTTAGTAGSSFTPIALDNGDPASSANVGLGIYGAEPTLTANSYALNVSMNQRSSFRWVAFPGGELIIPATNANGLALICNATTGSANHEFCIHWEE